MMYPNLQRLVVDNMTPTALPFQAKKSKVAIIYLALFKPSVLCLTRAVDLIRSHGGIHLAAETRDVLDVAVLVHRLAVFVGRKINRQIYWFAAKVTGNVWDWVTTHKNLLWTVTSRIGEQPKANCSILLKPS
jgi:hypothetical protein